MNLLLRILRRLFSSVILAVVALVGAPAAFGVTVLAGLIFLPLPATIPLPKQIQTIEPTVVYDRYGHPIATLASFEQDLPFTDAQVPQVLKEAVIADEDRNFYHDNGVDVRGLVRAAWADIRNRAPVQGASTIAEQYVKVVYTGSQRTIVRKVKDAILASQLSREASKEQILYHYLTVLFLGNGNTGVESASEMYFHKPIQDLDASQAATIAGLIPAPSNREPENHLASAEAARGVVLKEMYQQHYLTYAQYQQALSEKLVLATTPKIPKGSTVVYPPRSTKTKYPDFVNYVEQWLDANIPAPVLAHGGLRVQTTLDPTIQNDAYQAVNATLDGSAFPVDMALVSLQPQTGFVEAVVGGRDFGGTTNDEQDNLALGGCQGPSPKATIQVTATCWSGGMIDGGGSSRLAGSAFKPFTLATAFEQGIPPSTVYSAPYVYGIPDCVVGRNQQASVCQVHNDEGDIGGATSETLAEATAQSTNTVYAQVVQQVGCPNVAQTAKKLGIETAYYSTPPFYYCATYTLGVDGVTPLDMASAYGVFAAHGQKAPPTPILEIVNSQGKVLVDNIKHLPKTTSVLSANVADNVTNVLQGVIQHGTGTTADIGRPAAGKTGTTSNSTDAWFVGYTPTLSTAVWMGNVDKDSRPVGYTPSCPSGCVTGHYLGGGETTFVGVYGAEWPAITWKEFMQAAMQGVPVTPFSQPAAITKPAEAPALQAVAPTTTTSTTLGLEPGDQSYVSPTPLGGPYEQTPNGPVAPPPPTTTTSTTSTTTTTTVPGQPPPGPSPPG